jgi:hypothetical protein
MVLVTAPQIRHPIPAAILHPCPDGPQGLHDVGFGAIPFFASNVASHARVTWRRRLKSTRAMRTIHQHSNVARAVRVSRNSVSNSTILPRSFCSVTCATIPLCFNAMAIGGKPGHWLVSARPGFDAVGFRGGFGGLTSPAA